MNKIISIGSMVLLLGSGGYAYQSGLIREMFNPTVQIVMAETPIHQDQRLSLRNFSLKTVALKQIEAGDIVVERSQTKESVLAALSGGAVAVSLKKGERITVSHFANREELYIAQLTSAVLAGSPLDSSNVKVMRNVGKIGDGTIAFSVDAPGLEELATSGTLIAKIDKQAGEALRLSDIDVGGARIFALAATSDHPTGKLAKGGLKVIEVSQESLGTPTLIFASEDHARKYMEEDIYLPFTMLEGDILPPNGYHAASVRQEAQSGDINGKIEGHGPGGQVSAVQSQPETMAEYKDYKASKGSRLYELGEKNFVRGKLERGIKADVWEERSSFEGDYGYVKFERILRSAPVLTVSDSNETVHWIDGEINKKPGDDRILFALKSGTSVIDYFGNGAVCAGDYCTVSNSQEVKLKALRESLANPEEVTVNGNEIVGDAGQPAPPVIETAPSELLELGLMDDALRHKFERVGFSTPLDISSLAPADIQKVAAEVGIDRAKMLEIWNSAKAYQVQRANLSEVLP